MPRSSTATFGALLRQYRLAAGLTQEGLAERAGLSVHGIQKLERGATHPFRDTAQRLEVALQLEPDDRALFLAAVRPVRRHGVLSPRTSGGAAHHNLPIPTTTFVPRQGEIERVIQRVDEARLLTITGSGGCGKTRLAVEVGRQLVSEFDDGVWLVDLAPLADASLLARTIANTIDLHETPGPPPLDALTEHLRSRRVLLILDNCEHVIDASAEVVDTLLRVCANLQVIATSRELLGVGGEAAWPVRSLSMVRRDDVVAAGASVSAATVLATEAGRLFTDRAQLVLPSFTITDRNALAVALLCQRLDGIPLAIELAAARLTTLSVDQIAARLDRRFRLLTGGNRTAVRRQQTLGAAIDWSYELLSDLEQRLLRRLSVFAGGWSLEAAEAVGADSISGGEDVLELLSQLVAKSMVLVEEPRQDETAVLRYRFLETIRQYAEQKLLEAGEADRVRTQHRDWYLSLAEQGMDGMEGPDQKQWWERLELEHDNLRAALAWSASEPSGAPELLRIAACLGRFWQWRGHAREGLGWLDIALARSEAIPSSDRARALNWRGQLERANGNSTAGRPFLEESIAQARAAGDGRVLSIALRHLAMLARSAEEHAHARGLIEEALAVSRQTGWKREIAWNLSVLGENLAVAGKHDAAEPLLEESIVVGRKSGDLTPVLRSMLILGAICGIRGDFVRARRIVEDGLSLGRELDIQFMTTGMAISLGDLAAAERHWDAAERAYRETLESPDRGGTRAQIATAARRFAAICGARGEHRRAVRLLSATASIGDAWYPLILFDNTPDHQAAIANARDALGEDEFAREWAAGQLLTLEQAIAQALTSQTVRRDLVLGSTESRGGRRSGPVKHSSARLT